MSGIEGSIKKINEFRESYEGLEIKPNLISIDGPDGVGKTTIIKKVLELLKERQIKEGKNPDDIVYLKLVKILDSKNQQNLCKLIKECKDKTGAWDKERIGEILNLWSTRTNRSYGDHVIPLVKEGKIVILDRSELDIFRGALELGNKDLVDKITEYMKNGTLTHGINAGNRIFISSSPEEAYENLTKRNEPISQNDPRSIAEMRELFTSEDEAEKIINEVNKKEKPNIIKIINHTKENTEEREAQIKNIAEEIISKLQLSK